MPSYRFYYWLWDKPDKTGWLVWSEMFHFSFCWFLYDNKEQQCRFASKNKLLQIYLDPPPSTLSPHHQCRGEALWRTPPLSLQLCISWPRPQSSIIVWQEHKQRRDKHTLILDQWSQTHHFTMATCVRSLVTVETSASRAASAAANVLAWSAWFHPQPKVSGHMMPTFSFMVSLSDDEHRVGEGRRGSCETSVCSFSLKGVMSPSVCVCVCN